VNAFHNSLSQEWCRQCRCLVPASSLPTSWVPLLLYSRTVPVSQLQQHQLPRCFSHFTRAHVTLVQHSSSYFATDGQSASPSWCRPPIWGQWPDLYYCRTFSVFMLWGALWRKDWSVIYPYNSLWLSGPFPQNSLPHLTVSFETTGFPFVSSYDSQRYGGGILSRLSGVPKPKSSTVTLRPTVSRPVCLGVRHPCGTRDQFISFN
jgi:hypothetical protein